MDLAMPQMPLSAACCIAIAPMVWLLILFIKAMIQEAVPSLSVELSKGDQDMAAQAVMQQLMLG